MPADRDSTRDRLIGEIEALRARVQELERRVRHVGKLESVGRLAGGVAHDFNNALQAIQGYADLARSTVPPDHKAAGWLDEVLSATERAASLTRQLVAFSHGETDQPRSLDVNEVVESLANLLRRLIGEDILLYVYPGAGLGRAYGDPGQLEQALMHVCLDARAAMPAGGELTLETTSARAGPEEVEAVAGLREGEYVVIDAVRTGRAAAPEDGGPGLSTARELVQDLGGVLAAHEDPRRGATVRVYLPVSVAPAAICGIDDDAGPAGGNETILLAEDDDLVRDVTGAVLGSAGYRLLVARNGDEALGLLERHRDEIDLVVTDVVMPGRGGRELYDAIEACEAKIPVLFSSGYGPRALEGRLPDRKIQLLLKPYAPVDLLSKVRELLDRR